MKEITVMLELSDDEYDYLVGLNALRRLHVLSEDRPFAQSLADMETLSHTLSFVIKPSVSCRLARQMYDWKTFFCLKLSDMGKGAELADVLERYPALSMELGDDKTTFEKPQSEEDGEPETLVSVRDASGVVRMVTLDEAEAMREAAQGIYEGRTPEPQEEPEMVDVYHIVDENGVILETVETNLYTEALERRDMIAERLDVHSEMLDIMDAEEYEAEWGDGEEEETETVSNAKELPAVRRGPLMDDRTDTYIYYLEHDKLPSGADRGACDYDRPDTDSPALERDLLFADALYQALYA